VSAEGWPVISLRAIAEPGDTDGRADGDALWPARWPAEALEKRRALVGEYGWASLFQGRPRPRGGTVFGDPHYYDRLPEAAYRIGHGCDLAYTAKTSSDYSVCVTLYQCGDMFYVADVQRKQVDAPSFTLTLKAQQSTHPGPMLWHASGTEKGAAQFIQRVLPQFRVKQTTADKFVRAQSVAAAWNAGKVLVPRRAPWLDVFVAEVCGFTGVGDVHDDQVDALASAHDVLGQASTASAYSDMLACRGATPQRRRI
jgi:predicted phage terminase large subunit-like protein